MATTSQSGTMRIGSPRVVISRPHQEFRTQNVPTSDEGRSGSPRGAVGRSAEMQHVTAETEAADYPRSRDERWKHNLPVTRESHALEKLKLTWKATDHTLSHCEGYDTQRPFVVAELDDFEIYIAPNQSRFPHELVSLEYLDVRGKQLLCDGVLSIGGARYYVQGVQLKVYSIEGYGEIDNAKSVIYLQSQQAGHDRQYDLWYRLGAPSPRYEKFHSVFQWLATLGKHFIDFLESQDDRGVCVSLIAFRKNFCTWLTRRFANGNAKAEFKRWLEAFGGTDFRRSINAHIDYLRQEAYNLNNADALLKHPVWADCMRDDHEKITPQPLVCKSTTTTPHVYQCFKNRYFAKFLNQVQPSRKVEEAQEARKRLLGFPCGSIPQRATSKQTTRFAWQHKTARCRVGDVVSILPDETEVRMWRKEAHESPAQDEWYAYVQRTETLKNGSQRLYVIWLYKPQDTTISTTDYPIRKELFMSDHCNCEEEKLLADEVARRYTVEWFSKAMDTPLDFLVRQKYSSKDSSFVSLRHSHFRCTCSPRDNNPDFWPDDAVYITRDCGERQTLEPAIVVGVDRERREVSVRKLLRLQRDCYGMPGNVPRQGVADNELVWTDEVCNIALRCVQRKCHVRYFSRTDVESRRIPFPYDRGGAGDFWVVSSQAITYNSAMCIKALKGPPAPLNQGPIFRPLPATGKLKALSLFSGCGNLDAGLEQGGAVEFETAVEMCPEAVHTLYANAPNPEKIKLWLGSVDDYLYYALLGENTPTKLIAMIGDVAVIAAGSPCPGFSTLQKNWLSDGSRRNASHVTTFCSFLDIYRPKYAFLENVINMACTRPGFEKELVLSQIIACLVSMGYQVQQFIMSAWNYGSPQGRSRLILSVAAPGLTPLEPPSQTHSHPGDYRCRSIGELLNGQRFGAQDDGPTPFTFVTAQQATRHLPDIGTAQVQGCIEYPDHRLWRPLNWKERSIIKHIPKNPPGQGLLMADKLGVVPRELYADKKELGNSYKRVKKDGLFPVALTQPSPHDTRAGRMVHWSQDRPLSIEEFRIAQGFPSDFVLIGSISEQMKMVGNAVDRRVSEVLGIYLRFAIDASSLSASNNSSNGVEQQSSHRRATLLCVRVPKPTPLHIGVPKLMGCNTSPASDINKGMSEAVTSTASAKSAKAGISSPLEPAEPDTEAESYPTSPFVAETPDPWSPCEPPEQYEPCPLPSLGGHMDFDYPEHEYSSGEHSLDDSIEASASSTPQSMLGRLSRSFLQGLNTLHSSISIHQGMGVTRKRARTGDSEVEVDQPQKRNKYSPKWNPHTNSPSNFLAPTIADSTPDSSEGEPCDRAIASVESPPFSVRSSVRSTRSHHVPTSNTRATPHMSSASAKPSRLSHVQRDLSNGSLPPARVYTDTDTTKGSSATSRHASAARRTRRSGLGPELTPGAWHRVVEREVRRAMKDGEGKGGKGGAVSGPSSDV